MGRETIRGTFVSKGEYSIRKIRRNGIIDGKSGIPSIDEKEHSPYEKILASRGKELVDQTAQAWLELNHEARAEYATAEQAIPIAENKQEEAKVRCDEARSEFDEIRIGFNPGDIKLGYKTYWVILVIIAVGEFPLNAIVFRLFGEAELMTYAMTAVLAFTLPFCAHFLGTLLRRLPLQEAILNAELLLTILDAAAAVAVILSIAYIRGGYLGSLDKQTILNIELSVKSITRVFMAINFLIFLAATLGSYFAHDPATDAIRRKFKDAQKRLNEVQDKLADAGNAYAEALRKLNNAKSYRENAFEQKKSLANEYIHFTQRMIEHYRTYNLRGDDLTLGGI